MTSKVTSPLDVELHIERLEAHQLPQLVGDVDRGVKQLTELESLKKINETQS
jgi:hypothetical protein